MTWPKAFVRAVLITCCAAVVMFAIWVFGQANEETEE